MFQLWTRAPLLLSMVVTGACLQGSFDFKDGTIKCGGNDCPPGFACRSDDFCYHSGGGADAPLVMTDAPLTATDGPLSTVDARPPGPTPTLAR
jgi:hypothetical protein